MNVPFANLSLQYQKHKPNLDRLIADQLEAGVYVGGETVKKFERTFAEKVGSSYCVSLGNATDGLFFAIKALGLSPNDEVITPAWSWISTSECISFGGAKIVFADVDPFSYVLTAQAIEAKITSATKAVIVVHLYGQAADIKEIKSLCSRYNLMLIEDCSQAHFTMNDSNYVGTSGLCGIFSFYPTKNLGAYGDGGCLISDDISFVDKIRRLANHGGLHKDDHLIEGLNSRLDSIQATVINYKLQYIDVWNERRIQLAYLYQQLLGNINQVILPQVRLNTKHTFHLFVIQTQQRNELKYFLEQKGVQTMIHYPCAIPFEPAYARFNFSRDHFPVAYQLQNSVLSLPLYPELTEQQVEYVCETIRSFYERD